MEAVAVSHRLGSLAGRRRPGGRRLERAPTRGLRGGGADGRRGETPASGVEAGGCLDGPP